MNSCDQRGHYSLLVFDRKTLHLRRICTSIALTVWIISFHCVLSEGDHSSIPDSVDCFSINLSMTKGSLLHKCKKKISARLKEIDVELHRDEVDRRKRYSPVSASLPDVSSAFFLDRVRSIQVTQEEELNSRAEALRIPSSSQPFEPIRNNTVEECKRLSQKELVTELKEKGTYNPDLMAWDASGLIRFLDRSIVDQYEHHMKPQADSAESVERNIDALEKILSELNLHCIVRSPAVLSRLRNLTSSTPRRSVISPSLPVIDSESRSKREIIESLMETFRVPRNAEQSADENSPNRRRQKLIGDVRVIPFGCDKRGGEEDGYLRLCGACQAIRRLPDTFFPPFINEVMCDEDKACLYFYEFPHGKCKQKHMNFVVLRNVGSEKCQVWQKFNLNVRVSCECFVDEMSFFAKYV